MGKRDKKRKKDKSLVFQILVLLVYILLLWEASHLLVKYVVQKTYVEGTSMEATLYTGDALLVDKLAYYFIEPERYDIIVFPSKEQDTEEKYLIKRIVGLPGDQVQIKDGVLLINGVRLSDDPSGDITILEAGSVGTPIQLGPDEYFVMGDNRNESKDSRYQSVGTVKRSSIIGRSSLRIAPLNRFGLLGR